MAMADVMGESGLIDVSVKAQKELDQALREFARLEQCRSYRQIVIFLLEAMIETVNRKPWLRLKGKPQTSSRMEGQIRADVPASLYQTLEGIAKSYGMEVSDLVRIFLEAGLSYHQRFVPPGEIARKEELVSRIVQEIERSEKPLGAD